MFSIIESLNLMRYLIVLRPRQKLVQLPACLASDLSAVLGTTIAAQLPTREAYAWEQTRALWTAHYRPQPHVGANPFQENPLLTVPPAPWPIDAVFFNYQTKRTYGQDEPIVWELKLFGAAADHGFFLEHILAALEATAEQLPVGIKPESRGLWGQYRISAVYAARGPRWEPLVEAGKLNLDYYPTALQWREGLAWFSPGDRAPAHRMLVWVTPFDFGPEPRIPAPPQKKKKQRKRRANIAQRNLPTVEGLIHALMTRTAQVLLDKKATAEDAWALIPAVGQEQLWEALNQLQQRRQHEAAAMGPPPPGCFGQWIGKQKFAAHIPAVVIPYLQLASILHVGHHTHFGCGTFLLR